MRLTITSIADRGNHAKERIVMKVTSDLDVGKYAVFRSVVGENGAPSSDVTDVFWFPDKNVKADDLVVLYTKAGNTLERPKESGGTTHFYYWGKAEALWSSLDDHVPVLINTPQWEWFKG